MFREIAEYSRFSRFVATLKKYHLLALITRPPDGVLLALAARRRSASLHELRSFVIVRQVSPPLSSGRSLSVVRQVSLSGCFVLLSVPHAYMNDLDIDLARNTPWVDMSACVKFGLDRPRRLAGHTEHRYRQRDKHNAFYYIDECMHCKCYDHCLKKLTLIHNFSLSDN